MLKKGLESELILDDYVNILADSQKFENGATRFLPACSKFRSDLRRWSVHRKLHFAQVVNRSPGSTMYAVVRTFPGGNGREGNGRGGKKGRKVRKSGVRDVSNSAE